MPFPCTILIVCWSVWQKPAKLCALGHPQTVLYNLCQGTQREVIISSTMLYSSYAKRNVLLEVILISFLNGCINSVSFRQIHRGVYIMSVNLELICIKKAVLDKFSTSLCEFPCSCLKWPNLPSNQDMPIQLTKCIKTGYHR